MAQREGRSRSEGRPAGNSHVQPSLVGTRTRPDDRAGLARDLHDGVQNELLSLILRLKLAEEDFSTPPALAATFAALGDHAAAALDSLREIAHGVYPLALIKLGVAEALREQAARASVKVSVAGTTPRSTDEAETAMYFCCSEAIQNAAKHAGRAAEVKLSLRHNRGTLVARIEDDGLGFDSAQTADGEGLRNIRERVRTLAGTLRLRSAPGHGTVVIIWLQWPSVQPERIPQRSKPAERVAREPMGRAVDSTSGDGVIAELASGPALAVYGAGPRSSVWLERRGSEGQACRWWRVTRPAVRVSSSEDEEAFWVLAGMTGENPCWSRRRFWRGTGRRATLESRRG